MEFTDEEMQSARYARGDAFSFLRKGNADMTLRFSNTQGQVKYRLLLTNEMKLTDSGKLLAAASPIPGTDRDPHWIPFWVDMREPGRIVAGTGASVIINFTATDGEVFTPLLTFYPSAKEEQIIYCDKKGV